jgi:hypothetical protein
MDSQFIQASTQDFNLPHDIVPLPTGGIFYKNKKKSVKVGYLTANDENIIINGVQNNRNDIVISLIRSKLYEHDIKPDDLLYEDIEALLIFLRNTSFGSEYVMNLTDPKTDKKFETSIQLDELNIKKPEISPDSDGNFVVNLPKTGNSVKIRPITYGETLEIERMSESYPPGRPAPKTLWTLGKMIVELDGNSDKTLITKFIDQMPIMDSKFIRKFINTNVPSLDLKKQVMAPSGEIVDVNINFGVEFFRPFF